MDGSPPIPPFFTHYSFMNVQEELLDRRLPIQFVAYQIHLRLLHSGMSAEQALGLPPADFARFMGQCLQPTRDAALVPYNPDEELALCFSMTGGLTLGLRGTEDMVSLSSITPHLLII